MVSREMLERVRCPHLRRKIVPVEASVDVVDADATLVVSGFTKSGEPKSFLPALARSLLASGKRISLLSGASLSEEVEGPLAPMLIRRAPYMSCAATRARILAGEVEFSDVHLSQFGPNLVRGFYGPVDVAVIEVSEVLEDGSVVLTSSVGVSVEALHCAKAIVLEVNTAMPDYRGIHDLLAPAGTHEIVRVPIERASDRIGRSTWPVDRERVVAVVESAKPDFGVAFATPGSLHRSIAQHVLAFLLECRDRFHWGAWLPPIQSGVGNVANAIVAQLGSSHFESIEVWSEVFQDGMLDLLEDGERLRVASAAGLSFSHEAAERFQRAFDRVRERLILRPMWISNSPEVISRLQVVAMNTPLEVDIYGHANSTHVQGSKIVNGLGGSGDFLRNAYLGIVHLPSWRRLRNGAVVSCVLPCLEHIDHTEHDIKCIVTENGYVDLTSIRSGRHRAREVIDRCAHPHFRPLLHEYMRLAGAGDEPHLGPREVLQAWWRDYDEACRAFPLVEDA